jgi:hypothetical protein
MYRKYRSNQWRNSGVVMKSASMRQCGVNNENNENSESQP